ncbi:MAG: DNA-directed RNA polymerase subunit omega [Peptostreptococcaceae bacterium]
MIKPSINEVLNQIDNRYYLVVTVAKRSRELIDGAIPYVPATKHQQIKPVTLATQEVADRKIGYRKLTEEEIEIEEARQHLAQVQNIIEE